MYYTPHHLYVKNVEMERDQYGRYNTSTEDYTWVCVCRCDDNNYQEFTDDNGNLYRPKYHIVCPKNCMMVDVKCGDYIRVDNTDKSLRGEGYVTNLQKNNYLDYVQLWV